MQRTDMSCSSTTSSTSEMSLGDDLRDNYLLKHSFASTSSQTISLPSSLNYKLFSYEITGVGESLGEGASGSVYIGKYRGDTVAIKSPKLSQRTFDDVEKGRITQKQFNDEHQSLEMERECLEKISDMRHVHGDEAARYIIKYFGAYKKTLTSKSCVSGVHLVMEYAIYGSLGSWIFDNSRSLEWDIFYSVAGNVACGLDFLHTKAGILHCDIKPDNILLQEESGKLIGKICDFGISINNNSQESSSGTPGYIAPEIVLGNELHSEASDIYSFGIVLWGIETRQKISDVIPNQIDFVYEKMSLEIPENMPSKIGLLMKWSLFYNPKERPTAKMASDELASNINDISPRLLEGSKSVGSKLS